MPHVYTSHDTALVSQGGNNGPPQQAAVGLVFANGKAIQFQFPPKIPTNKRSGSWEESQSGPNAGDVIATFKSADPRKISMKWNYIVDGGIWTPQLIEAQLSLLRSYFANQAQTPYDALVIKLTLWGMGGKSPMSYRMVDADIKHGDAIVGVGANAFHLKTDVSVELRSWPLVYKAPVTVTGQITTPPDWY